MKHFYAILAVLRNKNTLTMQLFHSFSMYYASLDLKNIQQDHFKQGGIFFVGPLRGMFELNKTGLGLGISSKNHSTSPEKNRALDTGCAFPFLPCTGTILKLILKPSLTFIVLFFRTIILIILTRNLIISKEAYHCTVNLL